MDSKNSGLYFVLVCGFLILLGLIPRVGIFDTPPPRPNWLLLSGLVSVATWVVRFRPKNWEDPGWGRRIGVFGAVVVGGFLSSYFVGGAETVATGIAALSGSLVGGELVSLNPQPLPPKAN